MSKSIYKTIICKLCFGRFRLWVASDCYEAGVCPNCMDEYESGGEDYEVKPISYNYK